MNSTVDEIIYFFGNLRSDWAGWASTTGTSQGNILQNSDRSEKPAPLVWAANKKGGHVATARRSGFIIFSMLVNLFD